MCRSYQNCASCRDWHGHRSQAAQPAAAQLIGLPLCCAFFHRPVRRRVAPGDGGCLHQSAPSQQVSPACWSCFPADGLQTLPCGRASGDRHLIPDRHQQDRRALAEVGRGQASTMPAWSLLALEVGRARGCLLGCRGPVRVPATLWMRRLRGCFVAEGGGRARTGPAAADRCGCRADRGAVQWGPGPGVGAGVGRAFFWRYP
jgi:hypothetical protein